MTTPLGVREMARRLGRSASTVSVLARRGMPLSSVEEAREWLRANVRPDPRTAFGKPDDAGEPPRAGAACAYHEARTQHEAAKARLAELQVQELERSLLPADFVLRLVFTAHRQLRDQCMVLGRQLAPKLAHVDDEAAVRSAIDGAIREVFNRFADVTVPALVRELAGE